MVDKLGQLFIIGIRGPELTSEETDFIVKNNIGGVILFARNCESPQQIHKLCTAIQNLRHKQKDKLPLFISIDMEGGRVARLKAPFTQWPPMKLLGQLDSTSLAFKLALNMSSELRAVGINLDFAPCVDVLTNPQNAVIGDRALSTDPEHVAKMASALVRGFIKGEVIPCAKHFPGHGNTLLDSHEDLPVEQSSLDRLNKIELVPFRKVFRARLDMVMTAHIKFPQVDPEWPVTLSQRFLKQMIRDEYRYRNLIISDDLDMKALANNYKVNEIPVLALKAGCDIVLYCNNFDHPKVALEAVRSALSQGTLDARELEESYQRVVRIKQEVLAQPDPMPYTEATKIIGHPDHIKLSKAIFDGKIPEELLTT